MSLSDEIQKLADLKAAGALSEDEFREAKSKLLRQEEPSRREMGDYRETDSLGRAANRYVSFQVVSAVIAIIIFLIFFAPAMCSNSGPLLPPGFH